MNKQAILHTPDSQYCFAQGLNSVTLRLRVAKDEPLKCVSVIFGCKYNYHSIQLSQAMNKSFCDSLYDYYTVTLEGIDPRLVYIFALESNDGLYYFSEEGLSETYDFSVAYFNCFQLPFINECDMHKSVSWMSQAVFYQIFVERFFCGDSHKDLSYITKDWDGLPTPSSFAGGDLSGIQQKLPYIMDQGFNTLYLTPIFLSPSNHKYDTVDYTMVDPQFGTNDALKELIDAAHKNGMRIVLDSVFNHCSVEHAMFKDVIKHGKKSKYFDWFLIDGESVDTENVNYLSFGFSSNMPRWNTSNTEVQEYLIGVAAKWTREYGIDGWRLDVSDEVSHEFWRKFRSAIKQINHECVIIGENWHDAYPYLKGDQYDSIMNYGFTKACLDFFSFKTLNAKQMSERLSALLMRNTDTANAMMLNLLDSHDTPRFLTWVDGDIDKLLSALALTACFLGSPCFYYGTEIGMEGNQDPDCRRTFPWDSKKWNMEIKDSLKEIIALKKLPDLQRNNIEIKHKNNILIIIRGGVILCLNQSGKEQTIDINGKVLFARHYENNLLQNGGFCILNKEVI